MIKKIIKLICLTLFILFILLMVTAIVSHGGAGDRAEYYFIKGIYHIINPQKKPAAEITIDLKENYTFIENKLLPTGMVYSFEWWPSYEARNEEARAGLTTILPDNPFEYFKVTIILDDTTLVIPDAKIIRIYFKDYSKSEYRIKHPMPQGINSVRIFCLEGQPVLKNGHLLKRRTDYEFAFAQHQQLASMFADTLLVARDIHADEARKDFLNEGETFYKFLEYKNWIKENFEFTLIFKLSDKDYINSIHINPKERL